MMKVVLNNNQPIVLTVFNTSLYIHFTLGIHEEYVIFTKGIAVWSLLVFLCPTVKPLKRWGVRYSFVEWITTQPRLIRFWMLNPKFCVEIKPQFHVHKRPVARPKLLSLYDMFFGSQNVSSFAKVYTASMQPFVTNVKIFIYYAFDNKIMPFKTLRPFSWIKIWCKNGCILGFEIFGCFASLMKNQKYVKVPLLHQH